MQAEADWKKVAADSGESSAEALDKLRQLSLMQGNSGDYAAVRRTLEAYTKGLATLPDVKGPARDDPAVLSAWFDHSFADAPAAAENERTIFGAIERISADDAGSPAAERLLQRALSYCRSRDRAADYFRLLDGLEDRAASAVWPAEQSKTLVPRRSLWMWTLPAKIPAGPEWFTDPAFDDNTWRRGAGGFGGYNVLGATDLMPPPQFDAAQPVLFRCVFTPPEEMEKLKLRLRVLDGAILWINGQEVLRHNLTGGPGLETCAAKDVQASTRLAPVLLDATLLRPGANVLAAAVFHASARKSLAGFCFDAVLEGQ